MTLAKQLNRIRFALPLMAVALMAGTLPPPSVGGVVENVMVASLSCAPINKNLGPLALARVPGDLGPLTRRIHCN